ncbi:hypothetical protein BT93_F3082 [Corymbia citriodora subsp. variegata]|nr:hypothetical protein BT93_F3082 [Corymbia citriodora subsp. variegata]
MPRSDYSIGLPSPDSGVDLEARSVRFVHTLSEAGRILPSDSRWNSIELSFSLFPKSQTNAYESIPSRFSKSYDYDLVIPDKKHFKRFLYLAISIVLIVLALVLLVIFLPRKHKHDGHSKNLTLAVNQALTFFDAQKSGYYPKTSPVKFRGDSGLQDGNSTQADLLGGFYDSGNNIKFSFPTAYTVTLLSWSVLEYHEKYAGIGELDHARDIIRWGSDYLLKLFIPPNATSGPILYSQVGGAKNDTEGGDNDTSCWQRPEDMSYARPVSSCDVTASDLAGEVVAGLSAASLVFKDEKDYAIQLTAAAGTLFELAIKEDPTKQGTYTAVDECGGDARAFYNSTSFKDDLVWGGTWLFFATGNPSYLEYASRNFSSALQEERTSERGVFYWNNKLLGSAVLLARLLYFRDLGYPYEDSFASSANMTESVLCSYLLDQSFNKTQGGLILLKPDSGSPLQYAAMASFLSKLYSDYLNLLRRTGGVCSDRAFSVKMLQSFSSSQIDYILGDNPMKMSYVVGFGGQYPLQVHHRSASIPWDGQKYSCSEGDGWLHSKDPNPNVLLGAMVGGPDQLDHFIDERDKPWFTEPSIASNAGLVAALIAHHNPHSHPVDSSGNNLGIDQMGIFEKVHTST